MRTRTALLFAAAIAWVVTGLLFQSLPCRPDVPLFSAACLPESLEIVIVFLLVASVPWFTFRSATLHLLRTRAGTVSRLRAFVRYVVTSMVTVGAVFIAGFAIVLFSQAINLGIFSGESGMRVMIVALLASAWALAGILVMAVLLGMTRSVPECTGTGTQTDGKAKPVNEVSK